MSNRTRSVGIAFTGRDGQSLQLDARQRSRHAVFIGGSGSGKTTAMEEVIRQDVVAGRGLCVIDPHGDLYERILRFVCYRTAIGCRPRDIILFNPSAGDWVLPFDPFARPSSGDLSTAVDRRVKATLRAWGQQSADETPRLEKWLKVLYTALMESDTTIIEASALLDHRAHTARKLLAQAVGDPVIRRLIEHLSQYKLAEFLAQVESVENRLMRFLCSGLIRRTMGLGRNGLGCRAAMDEGKTVLVNLGLSGFVSEEQQRLIGTLLMNEFFEAAMQRPGGARPFYLYVDEAGLFVSPEIGNALEQCRKKGLHLTLAFQHLAQFKTEDLRLYKSIKNNAQTKVVFSVADREDASELADDLFDNLTAPELKFMRRHLNHRIEDIRQQSITRTTGRSNSRGHSSSHAEAVGKAETWSEGLSDGRGTSIERSRSRGQSFSETVSEQDTTGTSVSENSQESHSRGFSDTTSRGLTQTKSTATSVYNGSRITTEVSGQSKGDGRTSARTISRQDSWGSSHTEGHTSSHSSGFSQTTGHNDSLSSSQGLQQTITSSQTHSNSESLSETQTIGESFEHGTSSSTAVTDQPGVRHTAFLEENPEHWSLEEQRWRSAELLMRQPTGHCFVRSSGLLQPLQLVRPRPFYILPEHLLRLTNELYARHCIPFAEAERLLEERRQHFQLAISSSGLSGQHQVADGEESSSTSADQDLAQASTMQAGSIWNRQDAGPAAATTAGAPSDKTGDTGHRKRGPKPANELHQTVAAIVLRHGNSWDSDEQLAELCEELDEAGVPVPTAWALRNDGSARSWRRARQLYRQLVVKAIKYHCQAAKALAPQ